MNLRNDDDGAHMQLPPSRWADLRSDAGRVPQSQLTQPGKQVIVIMTHD